ncbi:hypothetical protein [uncultured Ruminococcus sp.]|uniref:hypothetical protein n=1 Tax=uncultured Ruminococcus sp. TaxID=165186 RepID=UPI00263A0907|nr:hypothetical protein [uncultured Ruminococcus sp.]
MEKYKMIKPESDNCSFFGFFYFGLQGSPLGVRRTATHIRRGDGNNGLPGAAITYYSPFLSYTVTLSIIPQTINYK